MSKIFDPSIVSPFDSTITRKYVIRKYRDIDFTYVDLGFFSPIFYEMFPIFSIFNIIFAYSIFVSTSVDPRTIIANVIFAYISGLGVTAGSHRLWTHRSYKARTPLKIFLAIGHTIGMQFSISRWCHIHTMHHKYSDTDADPHNIQRGPLYAHFGWMCSRVHPILYEKASKVDFSFITNDPILMSQHKYRIILELLFAILVPILIPVILFDENIFYSLIFTISRIHLTQNTTALVNSAAHLFGDRPFKPNIKPCENFHVSYMTLGEGYHK